MLFVVCCLWCKEETGLRLKLKLKRETQMRTTHPLMIKYPILLLFLFLFSIHQEEPKFTKNIRDALHALRDDDDGLVSGPRYRHRRSFSASPPRAFFSRPVFFSRPFIFQISFDEFRSLDTRFPLLLQPAFALQGKMHDHTLGPDE